MQQMINKDETLEELMINDLVLIQKQNGFRFGTDAVLLSDFARDIQSDSTLDLCSGSGIIPILLSHKSNAKRICGLEIQKDIHEMSVRSVKANNLEDKVNLSLGDLKNITSVFPKRSFNLVTCNPPYMKGGSGIECEDYSKHISRHEVACTLEDVIIAAESMLKIGGHFCMVHRPSRLTDIISLMRKHEIEPKRLRFVHPKAQSAPSLILVDGLLRGGNELKILPPLILYNDDGNETDELKCIYERR
ncbi:MAG: tRNA1(Val) (adenine(37)-N6)-methyltransferase [Eubacteriales bacterium]|nr:tRNA1(Val) (adenine(37)-N6)-methyltransferase [Eubacteriales bacterium]